MITKARVAIIGTGWWSTYAHIPGLQANPTAELVAVCDPDSDKLQAAATTYHLEHTYANYREMLERERPDGVVIATPHATHYHIAKDCLAHGAHVLLEKPMTLYAREARELVELAGAQRRELIIGYTNNFSSLTRRARAVMHSGELGAVQYINAVMVSRVVEFLRGDSRPPYGDSVFPVHGPGSVYSQPSLSGGGQGHLQLTHLAGLLFFVTGLRASQVVALMNNHGLAVDLVDAMTVQFEGGALGTFGGSGNAHQGKLELQVHCEQGSIILDLSAGTLAVRGPQDLREDVERQAEDKAEEGPFVTSRNLVDVILGRAANGAPGEVGWRAVELLDAAYRSAEHGGSAVTIRSLYS
jgi:predicted dehydrogenase